MTWSYEAALIKAYVAFEHLMLDCIVSTINNDTSTISARTGIAFLQHLTDEVYAYLVTGGGFFDFKGRDGRDDPEGFRRPCGRRLRRSVRGGNPYPCESLPGADLEPCGRRCVRVCSVPVVLPSEHAKTAGEQVARSSDRVAGRVRGFGGKGKARRRARVDPDAAPVAVDFVVVVVVLEAVDVA